MSAARVVLLAGPSGCGKSTLARASGLPVVTLDDFYKDGDDTSLPRHPQLGIVDWDDVRSWHRERALAALESLCRTGAADIPVYDIGSDRATGHREVRLDGAPLVVAEGVFAPDIVAGCRELELLADAYVLHRARWKNFARRLARDLTTGRKPPHTVVRRGWLLLRAEPAVVTRAVSLGCRPVDAAGLRRALVAPAPTG